MWAMLPPPGGMPCESECRPIACGCDGSGLDGRFMIHVWPPKTADWPSSQRTSAICTGFVAASTNTGSSWIRSQPFDPSLSASGARISVVSGSPITMSLRASHVRTMAHFRRSAKSGFQLSFSGGTTVMP